VSPKQAVLLTEIRKTGRLSLQRAVDLVGGDIYHNERFHVGNILSRMVKRGRIRRVKPGLFELAQPKGEPPLTLQL